MGEDGHTASPLSRQRRARGKNKMGWWQQSRKDRCGIALRLRSLSSIRPARHQFWLPESRKAGRLAPSVVPDPMLAVAGQAIKPVDGSLEWLVDSAATPLL